MKLLSVSISYMISLTLPKPAGVLLAGCLLSTAASAAGGDYLNMLEAEASDQSVDAAQQDADPGVPATSGDAYLNMLQSEADEIKKAGAAQPAPAETPGATSDGKTQLTAGLRFERFERELEDRFFGVYFRYRKLGETDRKRVYEQYRLENSIEMIRDYISHLDLKARRARRQSQ